MKNDICHYLDTLFKCSQFYEILLQPATLIQMTSKPVSFWDYVFDVCFVFVFCMCLVFSLRFLNLFSILVFFDLLFDVFFFENLFFDCWMCFPMFVCVFRLSLFVLVVFVLFCVCFFMCFVCGFYVCFTFVFDATRPPRHQQHAPSNKNTKHYK